MTQHFSHQEESDFHDTNAYSQDNCPDGDECELIHFAITEEYPQFTLKEEIKYENYLHPYREFKIYEFLQEPAKCHSSLVNAIPKTLSIFPAASMQ